MIFLELQAPSVLSELCQISLKRLKISLEFSLTWPSDLPRSFLTPLMQLTWLTKKKQTDAFCVEVTHFFFPGKSFCQTNLRKAWLHLVAIWNLCHFLRAVFTSAHWAWAPVAASALQKLEKGAKPSHLPEGPSLLKSGGSQRCEDTEASHWVKTVWEEWGKLKHKMPFEIRLIQVDIFFASAVIWAGWSIERRLGWGLNASPGSPRGHTGGMYNISDCISTLPCNERAEVRFSIHKKMKAGLGSKRENCWVVPYFLTISMLFQMLWMASHETGKNHYEKLLSQVLCCSSRSDGGWSSLRLGLKSVLVSLPKGSSLLPHLGSYTAPAGIKRQRFVGLGRAVGITGQQKAHKLLLQRCSARAE